MTGAPRPHDRDEVAFALDCDYCGARDVEPTDVAAWQMATYLSVTFTCPSCDERNEQEHEYAGMHGD